MGAAQKKQAREELAQTLRLAQHNESLRTRLADEEGEVQELRDTLHQVRADLLAGALELARKRLDRALG